MEIRFTELSYNPDENVGDFLNRICKNDSVLLQGDDIIDDGSLVRTLPFNGSYSLKERAIYYRKLGHAITLKAPFVIGQSLHEVIKKCVDFEPSCFDYIWQRKPKEYILKAKDCDEFNRANPVWIIKANLELNVTVEMNGGGKRTETRLISFNENQIDDGGFSSEAIKAALGLNDLGYDLTMYQPLFNVNATIIHPDIFIAGLKLNFIERPQTFRIDDPNEAIRGEVKYYEETASRENSEMEPYIMLVEKVRDEIKKQRSGDEIDDYNAPFIWVFAPSGSGKTQLAYSLNAAGCKCTYLVMDTRGNAQDIYAASRSVSARFKKCIQLDLDILQKIHADLSAGPRSQENRLLQEEWDEALKSCALFGLDPNVKLMAIGLIDALIEAGDLEPAATIDYDPMSLNQFLNKYSARDDIPCVCLDEFNLNSWKDQRILARNLIRALGLVCITMGTNSTAANIISTVALGTWGSSDSLRKPIPWVYVVNCLPKPAFESFPISAIYKNAIRSLENSEEWKPFFDWIESVPTRIPRFFRHALEALIKYFEKDTKDDLSPENALQVMLKTIRENLEIMKYKQAPHNVAVDWAVFGQIANIQPRYKDDSGLPMELIHSYFAELMVTNEIQCGEKYFPLYREYKKRIASLYYSDMKNEWARSVSLLKTSTEENIGTLVLLSTVGKFGNILFDRDISVAQAYFDIFVRRSELSSIKQHTEDNKIALGTVFEHFVQVAFVLSSAEPETKYFGTKIDVFCCILIANLDLKSEKQPLFQLDEKCALKTYCHLMDEDCPLMPLLGPLNESYDFLLTPVNKKLRIGNLRIPRNSEQVDGVIESSISWIESNTSWKFILECKYWTRNVATAEILKIVEKAQNHVQENEKGVIFIVARAASLEDGVNRPGTCFFQLDTPSCEDQLKFISSCQITSKKRAQQVKTIVIIISLTRVFHDFKISIPYKSSSKNPPLSANQPPLRKMKV